MKSYISSKKRRQRNIKVLGDIFFITLSIFLAYLIIFTFLEERPLYQTNLYYRLIAWVGILTLYIFVFYFVDIYDLFKIKDTFRYTLTIFLCVTIVSLVSSSILFFFPKYIIGRRVIVIHAPFVIAFLLLWRFIFINLVQKREKLFRLALIGKSELISNVFDELSHMRISDFQITQICVTGTDQEEKTNLHNSVPEFISFHEDIDDLLKNEDFDILAFDYTQGEISKEEMHRILELRFQDKFIYDFPSFYEELSGKVPLSYIDSRWLLSEEELQGKISKSFLRLKRLLDILFSATFLILTLPLYLFIAPAIKLDSKGKVFFAQERLGLRKQPFICYKFRTMKMEAEKETGPKWSSKDDPRITRVGKILRKIRLDELPQLWNILKGEMSFVGIRPERKYFADRLAELIPYYDLRFLVKPGLTGWAQVNHGYSGSEEEQHEKFQYELFYLKKMSIFLDFFIIFKTIKTVIKRKGE
ncbi:sugar transferase [Candidatus Woesearchaeota archaeon]|nr:sugar transferase [Candidatus Woesearchaeota archaeon]